METLMEKVGLSLVVVRSCSIRILMGGRWDSRFNKMSHVFDLDFKVGELNKHFSGFELNFEGEPYKNPLLFMDGLTNFTPCVLRGAASGTQGWRAKGSKGLKAELPPCSSI